jgi:hypothetical protein
LQPHDQAQAPPRPEEDDQCQLVEARTWLQNAVLGCLWTTAPPRHWRLAPLPRARHRRCLTASQTCASRR